MRSGSVIPTCVWHLGLVQGRAWAHLAARPPHTQATCAAMAGALLGQAHTNLLWVPHWVPFGPPRACHFVHGACGGHNSQGCCPAPVPPSGCVLALAPGAHHQWEPPEAVPPGGLLLVPFDYPSSYCWGGASHCSHKTQRHCPGPAPLGGHTQPFGPGPHHQWHQAEAPPPCGLIWVPLEPPSTCGIAPGTLGGHSSQGYCPTPAPPVHKNKNDPRMLGDMLGRQKFSRKRGIQNVGPGPILRRK